MSAQQRETVMNEIKQKQAEQNKIRSEEWGAIDKLNNAESQLSEVNGLAKLRGTSKNNAAADFLKHINCTANDVPESYMDELLSYAQPGAVYGFQSNMGNGKVQNFQVVEENGEKAWKEV